MCWGPSSNGAVDEIVDKVEQPRPKRVAEPQQPITLDREAIDFEPELIVLQLGPQIHRNQDSPGLRRQRGVETGKLPA